MSSTSSKSLGWSGSIPNRAGSSRPSRPQSSISPSPSRISAPARTDSDYSETAEDVAAFAEKFKYIVCSSGILEKDHVPTRRGRSKTQTGSGQVEEDGGEPDPDPDPGTRENSLASVIQDRMNLVLANSRNRPDIALAGLVLLGAIVRVVGWKLLSTLLVGVVALGFVFIWRRHISVDDQTTGPIHVSTSTDPAPVSQRPELAPSAFTIDTLQDFLTASESLDQTVDSSLSLLQDHPDIEEHHGLRVAIHRLYDQMTDQLATATSTFLEMVDKEELGVLGEMYDIPVAGSFFYPRHGLGRHSRDNTNGDDYSLAIPSPKRLSWNSTNSLIPLSLPMVASSSMPNRFNPHRKHPLHASMSGIPMDDRYTSLPPRTPRANKRSSWAPEWNDRIKTGFDSERRITESQENSPVIGAAELADDQDRQQNTSTGPLSPSPKNPQFTPRRSSPLSRADITQMESPDPQRHIIPIIPPTPQKRDLMPSPMVKSPVRSESKRQSLQGMPYYRSDQSDISSPGKASLPSDRIGGLRRVPSLQYSDLQMLREQSTRGSRRPSVSIISPFAPSAIPLIAAISQPTEQPRPQRISSLNPLSTSALKAACLGLHMKRRRMACCLLGLKFHDQDEEYWSTVRSTLRDLSTAITREVGGLEVTLEEAKSTPVTRSVNGMISMPPPWATGTTSTGVPDFAPRTSDQATLSQHVESMEQSLTAAWAELQAVKQSANQPGGLTEEWAKVRGSLGQLVREWERGKEVVSRIDPARQTPFERENSENGDTNPAPLPSFMKAWNDEEKTTPDTSFTSIEDTDTSSDFPGEPDLHTYIRSETLPPPGQDLVFESLPASLADNPMERSKLSREDRIKLMKEARDKGMTLGEMLNRRENGDSGKDNERQMMQMGGEVVGELKGMIGLIRRRKGLNESADDLPAPVPITKSPSLSPRKIDPGAGTGAERHTSAILAKPRSSECLRPPAGFAEDLRKAFVFPTPRVHSNGDH